MEPLPVLIVFLVGFAFWALTSARRIDDHQVEAVARMYSVPLSPAVVEQLRRRLLLVRRWRLVGALAGAVVCGLTAAFTSVDLTINALLFSIACGFAAAATGFELIDARRSVTTRQAVATAHPRTLRSAVPLWAGAPCAVAVVIVMALLAVSVAWPPEVREGAVVVEPLSPLVLGGLIATFVVVLSLAVLAIRLIVRASERGTDPADLIVRRATRLTAIMTVVGATWMSTGAIGTVVVQPLWGAHPGSQAILLLPTLYVAISPLMGFVATITAVPRRGGGGSHHLDTPGPRPIGEVL